ncbi:MAG: hypothetical protein KGJ13_07565 [Patescibacteria group bacterium]|nr:hypothetical protein [Patescibacteria group bacterium]
MYVVNFLFRNSNVQCGFTFKGFKNADELLKKGHEYLKKPMPNMMSSAVVEVEDDFGCKAMVDMGSVNAVILNDIDAETKRGAQFEVQRQKEFAVAMRTEAGNPANKILTPANGIVPEGRA